MRFRGRGRSQIGSITGAILVLLFAPLAVPGSIPELPSLTRVDEAVKSEMARRRIPGLAYAVVRDGSVPTMNAFGLANLETGTPVRTTSVFEIASMTKPMTATAVLLLVRQGRVGLDDPITKFIAGAPADWSAVTVRHLLTHTAGFPEEAIAEHEGSPLMDVSVRQQLDAIVRAPKLFAPGESAQYSDPGYFLLGMIIEKASGLRYADFMDRSIFKSLGMTATHVLDQTRIVPGRAMPYSIREDDPSRLVRGRRDWQHALPSHFGVYSSIEDLMKWEAALAKGKLLPREVLEAMWTPARLADGRKVLVYGAPYGFGWQVSDLRGRRLVEHGGYTGTHHLRYPDMGLSVIVLSNLDKASGNMPEMLARTIAGLVDPSVRPPHLLTPRDDGDPALADLCRTALSDIGAGRVPESLAPAHREFFQGQPEAIRKGMAGIFLDIQSFQFLGRDDVGGGRVERLNTPVSTILYFRSASRRGSRYFSFYLSAAGKIAYMSSYPY